MASDDIIYTVMMIISVALGPLFRDIFQNASSRRYIATIMGVLLLLGTCGYHTIHLIITVLGNCLILTLCHPPKDETGKRALGISGMSYLWNFGYLALFRTVHWFGIPAPSPVTNAAQLFLTLRMVGLAFEVQDTCLRNSAKTADNELKIKYCNVNVDCVAVVTYAFCYIGLFTGPYYKYRTYLDWINLPNNSNLNRREAFVHRALHLPAIAAAFLFFSYFFSIQVMVKQN
ncbi:Lysophospholipid acyltransferase 7 [Bulinus truncatus]|nr:Lysophospholipid acyltransferase 7 [Bulinus truncatus]